MKILQQDANRLVFQEYPDKYFFIAFLIPCILFLLVIVFRHNTTVDMITAVACFVFSLTYLATPFLVPTHITIDKTANTLLYRDFSILPTQIVVDPNNPPIYRYNPVTTIALNQLKQIEVKNAYGGILKPSIFNWWYNEKIRDSNIGICFIMNDNTAKYIFPGLVSYKRHRAAAVKIAEFLNIPFVDSYDPKKPAF
jgi:hypothetical protein